MFAAAAIVAQSVWMAAMEVAKFIATRIMLIYILTLILPWILKSYFIYIIKFLETYGGKITSYLGDMVGQATAGTPYEGIIDIHLNSVGGYLAEQIGLIDYCSIIISGYAIAWVINMGRIAAGTIIAAPKL